MKINVTDALNQMDNETVVLPSTTVSVLVSTQVHENYGTPELPYWKPKGGSDYLVRGVPAHLGVEEVLVRFADRFSSSDEMFSEYVLDARIVAEDFDPAAGESDPDWADFLRSSTYRIEWGA